MEPEEFKSEPPSPPEGSWLTRSWTAIAKEQRLPYAIARRIDPLLCKMGLSEKTARTDEYRVRVRRGTADEAFVENVLVREEYFCLSHPPNESDTVVDIGANIGCFALAAARYATRGRIVCVEPFPDNFRLLQRNLAWNGISNAITKKAAIVDCDREVALHIGNDTGMHSIVFSTGRGSVRVKGISLETLFSEFGINSCDVLEHTARRPQGLEFLRNSKKLNWLNLYKMNLKHEDIQVSVLVQFSKY